MSEKRFVLVSLIKSDSTRSISKQTWLGQLRDYIWDGGGHICDPHCNPPRWPGTQLPPAKHRPASRLSFSCFFISVWTMCCLGTMEMVSVFPTLSVITDFARSDRWESTGWQAIQGKHGLAWVRFCPTDCPLLSACCTEVKTAYHCLKPSSPPFCSLLITDLLCISLIFFLWLIKWWFL